MIRQLQLYSINHNSPELTPDSDGPLTWTELRHIIQNGCALLWVMHGEGRVLPLHILENLHRVAMAQAELIALGRDIEIVPKRLKFSWNQTVSWDEYFKNLRQVAGDDAEDGTDDRSPA